MLQIKSLCQDVCHVYVTFVAIAQDVCHVYVTFVAIAQDVCHVYVTFVAIAQDVCHIYVTCRMHAVLQHYFLTYPLFGRCLEFPSLSLSTVVHLTRAE